MMNTIYVCDKCGKTSEQWETLDDWLIASTSTGWPQANRTGEMVIRCPQHITEYAIRKAGGHIREGVGIVGVWEYDIS